MKNLWKMEIRRVVHNKGTWAVCLIMMVMVWTDGYLFYELSRDSGKYVYPDLFLQGWLPMDYQFVFGSLFRAMLPLFAAIPFGASYYNDKTSGYIKNICTKVSPRKYRIVKYMVTFLSGTLSIMIPLMFSLMLVLTYLPVLKPQPFAYQGLADYAFLRLFYLHPVWYSLFYILIDGIFGGLAAVCSLCVSDYARSRFSVLVLPFTVYLLGGAFLEQLNLSWLSIYDMVNPLQECPVNQYLIGITIVIGIVLTVYWFCYKQTKEDIL